MRKSSRWLLLIFGVVLLSAGIASALVWRSIQASKQKRTIGDLISLAMAIDAYSVDTGGYPEAKGFNELAAQLNPKYTTYVPFVDSWKHELRYERFVAADGKQMFYLGSAGVDGVWEHAHLSEYTGGPTTNYDDDILLKNQALFRYPRALTWLANERARAGR